MSEEQKPKTIECRLCRKPKEWTTQWNHRANEISEWSKVCRDCEKLWELGKKTMAATKADGKETTARAHIDTPTTPKRGDPQGPTEVRGKDIMLALGGIGLRGTELGRRFGDKGEIISITQSTDDGDNWYISGGGSVDFKVPRARAEAMKRIVGAFFNAIAKARVDGFNEGRNLIAALAKGEVSLDSYSEQVDNSRVGKKPKRRGDD
jgi:hypothetical protein